MRTNAVFPNKFSPSDISLKEHSARVGGFLDKPVVLIGAAKPHDLFSAGTRLWKLYHSGGSPVHLRGLRSEACGKFTDLLDALASPHSGVNGKATLREHIV